MQSYRLAVVPSRKPDGRWRRVKSGCLSCRRRHIKCDEGLPQCANCCRSQIACQWPPDDQRSPTTSRGRMSPAEYSEAVSTTSSHVSTQEIDLVSFYMSHFSDYNFQVCAWTALLDLPRKSQIPSILRTDRRGQPRKANWATFYLPHLSSGTTDDCLTMAISAFTAINMNHEQAATALYSRVLNLLRGTLKTKDAHRISNQAFLKIWATVLLLAEYEGARGNSISQAQHLDGAVTLSQIATERFLTEGDDYFANSQSNLVERLPLSLPPTNASASTIPTLLTPGSSAAVTPSGELVSRSERQLPQYLLTLTKRLEQSRSIRKSFDTEWPVFYSPAERNGLGSLLDKVSELYSVVMPVVTEYYERVQLIHPGDMKEYQNLMQELAPAVAQARLAIAEYRSLLDSYCGTDTQIYQSCAKPGFPFSPVIKFVNPIMAQPMSTPYMFTLFLAPFNSYDEQYESLRYISAVFAGFEDTPGLQIDASFPDIHVAAFWKPGLERDYFANDFQRRGPAFRSVLTRIWSIIDALGASQRRVLTYAEILGISLQQYRQGQMEGLKLKNLRH